MFLLQTKDVGEESLEILLVWAAHQAEPKKAPILCAMPNHGAARVFFRHTLVFRTADEIMVKKKKKANSSQCVQANRTTAGALMGNEASLGASLHEICADLNDCSWVFITELQRTAQRVMETLYENGLHINQGKYSACTHTHARRLSPSVRLWTVSGLSCCCVPGRAGTADLEHGLCHSPLAKEGTFKTDGGRWQKFYVITSVSLIDVF